MHPRTSPSASAANGRVDARSLLTPLGDGPLGDWPHVLWLREGVSLAAIGALLRHASIETTTLYAKVDVDLLREVAMPWPEVQPC